MVSEEGVVHDAAANAAQTAAVFMKKVLIVDIYIRMRRVRSIQKKP